MNVLSRIFHKLVLCPLGRHLRSEKHAYNWGDGPFSRCTDCAIPMKRINEGGRRWIVDEAALDQKSGG